MFWFKAWNSDTFFITFVKLISSRAGSLSFSELSSLACSYLDLARSFSFITELVCTGTWSDRPSLFISFRTTNFSARHRPFWVYLIWPRPRVFYIKVLLAGLLSEYTAFHVWDSHVSYLVLTRTWFLFKSSMWSHLIAKPILRTRTEWSAVAILTGTWIFVVCT